jgi:hypothetical protein
MCNRARASRSIAAISNRSPKTSLCFRETDFCRQRQTRRNGPNTSLYLKETHHAAETRLIRVIIRQLVKSQFAPDCVVGPGGLEPPTKRL